MEAMNVVAKEECANRKEEIEMADEMNEDNLSLTIRRSVYTDPTLAITGEKVTKEYTCYGKFLKCNVCKIEISGFAPFQQHLKGAKHKKRAAKLHMEETKGAKCVQFVEHREYGSDIPVLSQDEHDGKDNVVLKTCDICNIVCTGTGNFKMHLLGKNHKKQLLKMQLVKDLEENMGANVLKSFETHDKSTGAEMTQVNPFAKCNTCSMSFSGLKALKEHLSGNVHKKKTYFLNLSKKIKDEISSTGSEVCSQMEFCDENSENKYSFVRCRVCQKSFSGPVPYQQHLVSDAHERKMKNVSLVSKMKYDTSQDQRKGAIYDKDHVDILCISVEGEERLPSSHSKLKLKEQMMLKVLDTYPEMKRQALPSDFDAEPNVMCCTDNEDVILVCSICHSCFSGPESALEHCTSQNHLRAKIRRQIATFE